VKLYSYYRSSAAYRVRIALNYKQLPYTLMPTSLLKNEQFSDAFIELNPQARVPVLDDHGLIITQSVAIMEYLEEKYPERPLLPQKYAERAKVREIVNLIACDIHPLNNLSVVNYLKDVFLINETERLRWYHHWLSRGFDVIEDFFTGDTPFLFGESPSLADLCLIPQVYNAMRFSFEIKNYPKIHAIYDFANTFDYFNQAMPEHQPDCPSFNQ
jgi:maleylacetoacetate isomerase